MGHLVFEGNLYNVNHLMNFIAILYNTGVLLYVRYIIFLQICNYSQVPTYVIQCTKKKKNK